MGLGSKITVELYDYVPCAGFLINGPFNDAFVEGLGDCVTQGLAQAVGVSNFSADARAARERHPAGAPALPSCRF